MSARSKDLRVNIVGDADKLDKELRKSSGALDKFGKQTRLTGSITSKGFAGMRVAAVGATAALGGLVLVGRKVVEASIESEKSNARLKAQLHALDISYNAHADQIDKVIQKHSQLAGLDDEDLQDAFTSIVRTTGDVTKSLESMALVTDLARAKNMDVAKAGEFVAKIHAGNVGGLRRLGLEFSKTSENVDKLKKSNKDASDVELKLAEARDKQANSQRALGLLQDTFRGQAEKYGQTTAGAVDRANVAFENLQETIGAALAPTVEKVATKVADFVNEMQDGTGQGGEFVDTLKDVWSEAKPIVTWIGRATKNIAEFAADHPGLAKLVAGIVAVGVAIKALKFVNAVTGFSDLVKAGRTAAKALKRVLASGGTAAGEAAATNAASSFGGGGGKFRSAGNKMGKAASRGLVVGLIAGIVGVAGLLTDKLYNALGIGNISTGLGDAIKNGISKGLKSAGLLGSSAKGSLAGAIGDGVGRSLGRGVLGSSKGAGNLMGANSALRPLAAVGARNGLRVSSGKREAGGRTSSGGVSYHGSGEAIDMAGPPAGMMRTFQSLKSSVGGRLAELIYTPGGVGIKNGAPHRYTGQVADDHIDHIHAALDLGRPGPGIGDGYGKGRIQNLWTTAGGSADVSNLAAAVAMAESGGDPDAKNYNSNGSVDRGLWQINSVHGKMSTFDPKGNARAAVKISSGGRNWRPWVAYTSGSYKRFLQAGTVEDAPSASEMRQQRHDRAERAGSRAVNQIASRFAPSISKATRNARNVGGVIERADNRFGQSERFFGQVLGGQAGVFGEEDLDTAEGRAQRSVEVKALRKLKVAQLARMKKRKSFLKTAIGKTVKQVQALRKARDRSKGAKRAKIVERLKAFDDRLTDLRAELAGLGEQIADTTLDIGDLDKDLGDLARGPAAAAVDPVSPTDALSQALSDIDLQERAGWISPEYAQAARLNALNYAAQGGYGNLDQRQQWEVMAQLREAMSSQTEAQQQAAQAASELAAAIAENTKAVNAQLAFAGQVSSITSMEAVRALADTMNRQMGVTTRSRGVMAGSGATSRL